MSAQQLTARTSHYLLSCALCKMQGERQKMNVPMTTSLFWLKSLSGQCSFQIPSSSTCEKPVPLSALCLWRKEQTERAEDTDSQCLCPASHGQPCGEPESTRRIGPRHLCLLRALQRGGSPAGTRSHSGRAARDHRCVTDKTAGKHRMFKETERVLTSLPLKSLKDKHYSTLT